MRRSSWQRRFRQRGLAASRCGRSVPSASNRGPPDHNQPRSSQMSLTLYFHPLASYCWKALIALYENDTPFEPHIVNLADEASRTELFRIWPIGKFPVLRDDTAD